MPRRCGSPERPSLSPTASSFSPLGYQLAASAGNGALVYREQEQGWHLTWFDRVGRHLGDGVPAAGQYNGMCLLHDGTSTRLRPDRCQRRLDQPGHLDAGAGQWSDDTADVRSVRATSIRCARRKRRRDRLCVVARRPTEPVPAGGDGAWQRNDDAEDRDAEVSDRLVTGRQAAGLLVAQRARRLGHLVPPLDGGTPSRFCSTPAEERNGRLSPDGRYSPTRRPGRGV